MGYNDGKYLGTAKKNTDAGDAVVEALTYVGGGAGGFAAKTAGKAGLKWCSKNKDKIRKTACAAGFATACSQNKLHELDKIKDDLEMLERLSRTHQTQQKVTLPIK